MNRDETSYGILPFSKHEGGWKVLVILHTKGHWAFPKGHPEAEETPLETAQREFLEETGLSVQTLLKENPLSEHYEFKQGGDTITKHVFYFPAVVSGELSLQAAEVVEGRWLTFEEAQRQLTFAESKHLLQEGVNGLKGFFAEN